jgi:hypothetical protein
VGGAEGAADGRLRVTVTVATSCRIDVASGVPAGVVCAPGRPAVRVRELPPGAGDPASTRYLEGPRPDGAPRLLLLEF